MAARPMEKQVNRRERDRRGRMPQVEKTGATPEGRKLRDPLSQRLLAGILAVSLAAAAVACLIELGLSYRRSLELTRAELDAVQRNVKAPLERALQTGTPAEIERELMRTQQLMPVFYAQLVASDGRVYEVGRPVQPQRDRLQRTVKLEQAQAGGQPLLLGSVRLEASTAPIKSQLFERFLLRLLLLTAKLAVLSFCVLYLFRKLVTRHLAVIVAQMRRTTSLNLREPLQLDRSYADDEIGELAQAFNLMRRNMQHELDIREEHDRAMAAESTLGAHALNALPQAVLRLTTGGTVAWMNTRAERLCGLSLPEVQDMRLSDLLPAVRGSGQSSAEMLFLTARSTAQPVTWRIVLAKNDGTFEREATALPVCDETSQMQGVLLLVEDAASPRGQTPSPVEAGPL